LYSKNSIGFVVKSKIVYLKPKTILYMFKDNPYDTESLVLETNKLQNDG
jgi:hypothetical protein